MGIFMFYLMSSFHLILPNEPSRLFFVFVLITSVFRTATNVTILYIYCYLVSVFTAVRKQEIIKITEQLIEAINNGDFDAYT